METGVTEITMAASSTFNYFYQPVDGRVKWFIDELGARWVKFTTKITKDGIVPIDRVWPAERVVEVQYRKKNN